MNWFNIAKQSEITKQASSGMIEQYLTQMVDMMKQSGHEKPAEFAYASIYEYFLKNGKQFQSNPLSPEELEILKNDIKRHKSLYKAKQCFYNAQRIAQNIKNAKYVEGYVWSNNIPIAIEHAWNSLNGKVIDFTMFHTNNGKPVVGVIPEGWEYFGVELPTRMIYDTWSRHGLSISLVDNYLDNFPLLKQEKTEEKPKKVEPKEKEEIEEEKDIQ
jgi:hypothetical protein